MPLQVATTFCEKWTSRVPLREAEKKKPCETTLSINISMSRFLRLDVLTFGPPPCILRALTVATITAACGIKPNNKKQVPAVILRYVSLHSQCKYMTVNRDLVTDWWIIPTDFSCINKFEPQPGCMSVWEYPLTIPYKLPKKNSTSRKEFLKKMLSFLHNRCCCCFCNLRTTISTLDVEKLLHTNVRSKAALCDLKERTRFIRTFLNPNS